VVKAFVESPNYERGALFIIYDEWGGFFDHVTPPSVPDDRQSSNVNEDFGQMGFRIPAVTVSPFTRNHTGDKVRVGHELYGTESILKLITYRFGLSWPQLPKRIEFANNVGESFDWDSPDFERPDLAEPEHIVSKPCAMGGGDVLSEESATAHESDLADLEMLADRFGIPVGSGKPSDLFRKPDSVRKALAASR
jgi:phospholipase C